MPAHTVEAQFSIPFQVAAALVTGKFGWAEYRLLRDPRTLALARKVEVYVDEEAQRAFPERWLVSVEIRAGHRTWTRRHESVSVYDEPRLIEKLIELASGVATREECERLASVVRHLETVSDVLEITSFFCKPLGIVMQE